MTSNIIFPLTLKPTKKKNIALDVGKEKDAQLDIVFATESARSSKEGKSSVHGTKKEDDAEM
jgi:hypothetical protein